MTNQIVFIVDDDEAVRDALQMLLSAAQLHTKCFSHAEAFLKEYRAEHQGCLILDVRMTGMSGLELQEALHKRRFTLPIIFLTGHADVPMAVRALKKGAFDFIEKPLEAQRLVLAVMNALKSNNARPGSFSIGSEQSEQVQSKRALLTLRENEVLDLILQGKQTRAIADQMCISVKTVEFHRTHIREKLQVSSLAELFKLYRN